MRPIFYTILLVLLLSASSQAQVEGVLHKRFGLRAGANISTLSTSKTGDEISARGGFYMAAYYQFRLRHNIGLSWELGYSRLGCNNTYISGYFDTTTASANTSLNLDYLTMPVSLKIYLSKAFSLQMGLYGSMLLSAVEKGIVFPSGGYGPENYYQQIRSTFNTWDTGIQAGIGIEGRSGLNFTFKYYNSIPGIYPSFQQAHGISMRNEYFQGTMGFSFGGR